MLPLRGDPRTQAVDGNRAVRQQADQQAEQENGEHEDAAEEGAAPPRKLYGAGAATPWSDRAALSPVHTVRLTDQT